MDSNTPLLLGSFPPFLLPLPAFAPRPPASRRSYRLATDFESRIVSTIAPLSFDRRLRAPGRARRPARNRRRVSPEFASLEDSSRLFRASPVQRETRRREIDRAKLGLPLGIALVGRRALLVLCSSADRLGRAARRRFG